MIWLRKIPQEDMSTSHPTALSRTFSWLLFQTCFFGIAVFIILQIAATIQPEPPWLHLLAAVTLVGFAGGILGALIVFAMISARDVAAEE